MFASSRSFGTSGPSWKLRTDPPNVRHHAYTAPETSPRSLGVPALDAPTYAESELIMNRAPVLLSGGAPPDRAAWAQEAAEIGGKPLVTVTRPEQLGPALLVRSSVLFVPDVLLLGDSGQQLLVRTLTSLDERPKLVLGLGRSEASARQAGVLREDLHYRVRTGLLNLDAPGLKEAIAARRAQAARRAAAPPPRAPAPARMSSPSLSGRSGPARAPAPARPRPKSKPRPAQRSRSAPRLKSARTAKSAKRARPAKKGSKRR